MRREQDVSDEYISNKPGKGKRRTKRRYMVFMVLMIGLAALLITAPSIITSRAVLLPLIDKYAGIAPLKVDFVKLKAGWLTPISVEGLQVLDGNGQAVIKIGAITTEKNLISWISSSRNIGTIAIRDVDLDVAVQDGKTNIERAIEPLLASNSTPSEPVPPATSSSPMSGRIELTNARIVLRDNLHPDAWLVSIPTFKTELPAADQIVGPSQLSVAIADSTGTKSGTIAADVAEAMTPEGRSFNVRAAVEHVPLEFWHVVHSRLPDLPIDELGGAVSARMAGSIMNDQRWTIQLDQVSGDQLVVVAPQVVGDKPARLASLKGQGQATLTGGSLTLNKAQLQTDVGGVIADAKMPWPPTMPTITSPWLPGAQLNAQGKIDLAKLVQVAESLVPMREDTRLVSGQATFSAVQQATSSGQPSSQVSLQLGDLVAVAGGQQLKWDQPLKLSINAQPQSDGQVALNGVCSAEFCEITASGSPTSGQFQGKVDLDRMQQRVSQWIDLPTKTMTGTANIVMQWTQTQPGVISAEGQLNTTPLTLAMTTGGVLKEPAWQGAFTGVGKLQGTQLASIDRAHLELKAQSEMLKIDMLEPLSLLQAGTPAAFTLSTEGALGLWQQRAVMLKLIDPSMTLDGNYSLGASGRIDTAHLELQRANWRAQPFTVGMSGSTLAEPEMIGSFEGRVDTSNFGRLAVEKLAVQAHSFSLTAADSASAAGDGSRNGTGAFIVDMSQLMRNMQTAPAQKSTGLVLPPGNNQAPVPASQLAFNGQINGNLRWQVNTKNANLELEAKSNQIDIDQITPGSAPARLWSEAQMNASLKGAMDIASGNIEVPSMQLQLPWMHYAGTMQIVNANKQQTIKANGNCLYDAGLVGVKLQPYLGNNIQLAGRKTVPVEVTLVSGGPGSAISTLAGLQAATKIGWEQARVVGIEVGNADVPVSVTSGQLATKADIPVSGGTLRWDITSDLTANEMVIIQQPMTVLENVAITPQMCQSWLKYVTPLLAEATSVNGRLSLQLNQTRYNIANPRDQIIDGKLIIHNADVGPGPLSNQVIGLVQQINLLRKKDLGATVSNQQVWLQMPQQTIAFRMENGRVIHRDLMFHVGDVNLVSSGAVDIDGRMEINAAMPIPDDWIQKSPLLAGFKGQSLQFPIRGSLTSPQVDAQFLKDVGRQAVTQAAEGMIQQQLSRGLGKLFGPSSIPGMTPQPATPPGTSP